MKTKMLLTILTVLLSTSVIYAKNEMDNTQVNERDRNTNALTAGQQSLSTSDTEITRRIREEVMSKSNLSLYAKNVKIITVNGKVTLKGPVRSEDEQQMILQYANAVAKPENVVNEMSVVAQ
jgi:hyperosmotically inducible periplasmic protein